MKKKQPEVGHGVYHRYLISFVLSSILPMLAAVYLFFGYVLPYAPLESFSDMWLRLFLIFVVLAAIIGLYIGISIIQSVIRVSRSSELFRKLSEGETPEELKENIVEEDELARLSGNMNFAVELMREQAEKLNNLITQLNRLNKELKAANKRLEEMTIIDELTELFNRRYFNRRLLSELKRAERYDHPFALFMIDIDHFKVYNDINGHLAGDKILKSIAGILERESRDIDIVTRFGGEEFCVILPEIDEKEAQDIAERLRKAVESTRFENEELQPNGKLTVSIGVASFPQDAKTTQTLIEMADRAMYQAKKMNRNRVILAREMK